MTPEETKRWLDEVERRGVGLEYSAGCWHHLIVPDLLALARRALELEAELAQVQAQAAEMRMALELVAKGMIDDMYPEEALEHMHQTRKAVDQALSGGD